MSTATTAKKGFRQSKKPTKAQVEAENNELREGLQTLHQAFSKLTQLALQNQHFAKTANESTQQLHQMFVRDMATVQKIPTLTVKPATSTAEVKDIIIVDFVGQLSNEDGTPGDLFNGGLAHNFPLELGSNRFIPGFEEQLVGVKKSETKVIKITFPEDYKLSPELAGKEAHFTVLVKSVLSDPFAKNNSVRDVFEAQTKIQTERDEAAAKVAADEAASAVSAESSEEVVTTTAQPITNG